MSTDLVPAVEAASPLARIEQVHQMLAEATTLDAVRDIRDKAEVLRAYAKAARYGVETQNQCARLKIDAERKAGGMLEAEIPHQGGRPNADSVSALQALGIEQHQSKRWQKVAGVPVKVIDEHATRCDLNDDELTTAGLLRYFASRTAGQTIVGSASNEWYTPAVYIDAARAVLGDIDLDPASNAFANETVKAERYFDVDDDGLSEPWAGRVWLNPPYGRLSAAFIDRLLDEFAAGNVTAAVLLVNAHCTDTRWFRRLWDHTLCFTDHRIDFAGSGGGSTHGSVFGYLGPDPAAFAAAFAGFGAVVRRWTP